MNIVTSRAIDSALPSFKDVSTQSKTISVPSACGILDSKRVAMPGGCGAGQPVIGFPAQFSTVPPYSCKKAALTTITRPEASRFIIGPGQVHICAANISSDDMHYPIDSRGIRAITPNINNESKKCLTKTRNSPFCFKNNLFKAYRELKIVTYGSLRAVWSFFERLKRITCADVGRLKPFSRPSMR